jgi:hypothetical protein
MISLAGGSQLKTFRPLEEAAVKVDRKGYISLTNGEGREYFSTKAEGAISIK